MKRVIVLMLAFCACGLSSAALSAEQKSILVTGASSGIGRHLAETLAGEGHHVYAGARKDADLAELDAIENITAVRLDVTQQDEVDAVVALIREKGTGLYGLVNNAGVLVLESILDSSIDNVRYEFGVNVEGVFRTTQAFAPLVIESKGRIVSTSSTAGIGSGPGWTMYSASKHAVEAFTDGLAAEMARFGVSVSVVEPGNFKSKLRLNSVDRMVAAFEETGAEVPSALQQTSAALEAREKTFKEPDEVSEAFMHALFADEPLRRYVVAPNAGEYAWAIGTAINELVQLNAWGPYRYDRDELVRQLDAALKQQSPGDE
jgi:NAD(P)-dependent dehydrogenase (short-subunit alcohol dehydrogenase family)